MSNCAHGCSVCCLFGSCCCWWKFDDDREEGDLAITLTRVLYFSGTPTITTSSAHRQAPTVTTTTKDNEAPMRWPTVHLPLLVPPPTTTMMHPPSFRRAMISFHAVFVALFLSHHASLASASASQLPTDEHGDYDGSDIIAVRRYWHCCKRRYMSFMSSSTFVFSICASHCHNQPPRADIVFVYLSHSTVDQISPRRNHSSIIAHWSRNSRRFQFLAWTIRQFPSQSYREGRYYCSNSVGSVEYLLFINCVECRI
jgi:hypothetical protein